MIVKVGLGMLLVIVIGIVAILWIVSKLPETDSACTHDCDQGRRCTCGKKENENGIQ